MSMDTTRAAEAFKNLAAGAPMSNVMFGKSPEDKTEMWRLAAEALQEQDPNRREKPPLGLLPGVIVYADRIRDLTQAIERRLARSSGIAEPWDRISAYAKEIEKLSEMCAALNLK
jgi:hypothetical protein